MKIRFVPERNENLYQRNRDYLLFVDEEFIGKIEACFRPNQRNSRWNVPYGLLQRFNNYTLGTGGEDIPPLPWNHMKILLQTTLTARPDLSRMEHCEVPRICSRSISQPPSSPGSGNATSGIYASSETGPSRSSRQKLSSAPRWYRPVHQRHMHDLPRVRRRTSAR